MNNTEKKNWLRIVRPIALCLVFIFLLSCATYAWMKRDWHPTIKQDGVKIVAGSSLTFIFAGEDLEEATVNELVGMNDFVFKSVSNCSGFSEDFFALDYSTMGPNYDMLKKLELNDLTQAEQNSSAAPYTALGKKYGYVDLTFTVGSEDIKNKEVYFSADSKIQASTDAEDDIKAAKAIRMSIGVYKDDVREAQYVFTQNGDSHEGITNEQLSGYGYLADNKRLFEDDGTPVSVIPHPLQADGIPICKNRVNGVEVKNFSSWNENTLFVLPAGEQRTLKVCIWLEGEDENCEDDIAGSALDIFLKFSARNVAGE